MSQSSIINQESSQSAKPTIAQIRHQAQILRVNANTQLKKIPDIWKLGEEQLLEYFQNYQTMPYARVTSQVLFQLEKVKMVRTQHKLYFGQIYQKKKQGKGIAIYRNGKIYEGEFHLNEKSGYGVQVYQNGNVYVGDFSQNKKHGKGSFFWFNLCENQNMKEIEQYHGDWWGGLPDGMGEHLKVNGDMYVGSFKNGLKHGQGTQVYKNGDRYKGQFINGLPEGFGQYLWIDGSLFKGDFKQGTRNGYGLWRSMKGTNEVYKGHYMLDKKHGYGIYDWGNGYTYKGFWMDDLRYGQGELLFNNEVEYDGYWENGQKVDKKPNMENLNKVPGEISIQQTQKTLGSQSKITQRFTSSQEKRPKPPRNSSAERKRSTNKQQFSMSFNRESSHEKSRCGHKNCIPNPQIGKMPRPAWKNAWKK